MGRFTFDFGWSRRVPEHEGSLCRVLEIHAPGSLLEYGGSAVEIQSWGSLAFWYQDNPEDMSDSEVLEVDAKLERMAHTLLVQRDPNEVVTMSGLGLPTSWSPCWCWDWRRLCRARELAYTARRGRWRSPRRIAHAPRMALIALSSS